MAPREMRFATSESSSRVHQLEIQKTFVLCDVAVGCDASDAGVTFSSIEVIPRPYSRDLPPVAV